MAPEKCVHRPEPVSGTLFGKSVFADVVEIYPSETILGYQVGPKSKDKCPCKRKERR
jgi:hypothetical protein